jgi:beta-glucanase (GH16 family)
MMPEDSVYGDWPASGEIDLAESRGNDGDEYSAVGGRDSLISAMVSTRLYGNTTRTG